MLNFGQANSKIIYMIIICDSAIDFRVTTVATGNAAFVENERFGKFVFI